MPLAHPLPQVLADIQDECNKYGTVLRVLIPRPADPSTAAEVRPLRAPVRPAAAAAAAAALSLLSFTPSRPRGRS